MFLFSYKHKRLISAILALVFFLYTCAPAWAREGNTANQETWKAWAGGTIVAALTVAAAFCGADSGGYIATAAGSMASDLVGLYMYYNHYSTYGESVASFHVFGTKVEITRGQFWSMVAGVTASAVAGFATGAIKNALKDAGKDAGKETGKDVSKFPIDEGIKGETPVKSNGVAASGVTTAAVTGTQVAGAATNQTITQQIKELLSKIREYVKESIEKTISSYQPSKYIEYGMKSQFGKALVSLAKDLTVGYTRLLATRTIEEILIKKYGWDETLVKKIISPTLGIFLGAFVDSVLSNLICQFMPWTIGSNGAFRDAKQKITIKDEAGKTILETTIDVRDIANGSYGTALKDTDTIPLAVQKQISDLKLLTFNGSIASNLNPLSAGFWATGSLGWGPLVHMAVQAAVLVLLDYKTYYGVDDKGRKKENADKMILSYLVAGLAQRAVDSWGASNNLYSDSQKATPEMEKKRAAERNNFLIDNFLATGMDIAYTHFLINNELEDASYVTGFGYLIANNMLLGLLHQTQYGELVATSVGQAIGQSMFASLPLPYYRTGDTRLETRGQPVYGAYADIVAQWRMANTFQSRIDAMMRGGNPGLVTASTFGQNLEYFGSHVWSQQVSAEQQLKQRGQVAKEEQASGDVGIRATKAGKPGAAIPVTATKSQEPRIIRLGDAPPGGVTTESSTGPRVATPEEIYNEAARRILLKEGLVDDTDADLVRQKVLERYKNDSLLGIQNIEGVIKDVVAEIKELPSYKDTLTKSTQVALDYDRAFPKVPRGPDYQDYQKAEETGGGIKEAGLPGGEVDYQPSKELVASSVKLSSLQSTPPASPTATQPSTVKVPPLTPTVPPVAQSVKEPTPLDINEAVPDPETDLTKKIYKDLVAYHEKKVEAAQQAVEAAQQAVEEAKNEVKTAEEEFRLVSDDKNLAKLHNAREKLYENSYKVRPCTEELYKVKKELDSVKRKADEALKIKPRPEDSTTEGVPPKPPVLQSVESAFSSQGGEIPIDKKPSTWTPGGKNEEHLGGTQEPPWPHVNKSISSPSNESGGFQQTGTTDPREAAIDAVLTAREAGKQ